MRLRKVKNALDTLNSDNKYYISDPKAQKGLWKNIFQNDNPLSIEIGCGKGKFIIGMAKAFPNINFIAIEKYDSVLVRTLENALKEDIANLRLVLFDASNLEDIFALEEVNNIYLNFSDPWPKNRHAKRRLTSSDFLKMYETILAFDGVIYQKTDNRLLFEYSLESFSQNAWYLSNISLDLHKTDKFNITTEFEEKWSPKGPIYRLEAKKFKEENEQ